MKLLRLELREVRSGPARSKPSAENGPACVLRTSARQSSSALCLAKTGLSWTKLEPFLTHIRTCNPSRRGSPRGEPCLLRYIASDNALIVLVGILASPTSSVSLSPAHAALRSTSERRSRDARIWFHTGSPHDGTGSHTTRFSCLYELALSRTITASS